MTSAGNSRSAARYGSRDNAKTNSGSWTNKALVLIFAAMLVTLVFYGFQYFREKESVNAQISMVTQEVLSDKNTRVWVDVTRNHPDEDAYCIVQAYDYSKSEVGRREFAVPAGGNETHRFAVDVPTNARAFAGGAYGCSGNIPDYLDMDNPDYAESR